MQRQCAAEVATTDWLAVAETLHYSSSISGCRCSDTSLSADGDSHVSKHGGTSDSRQCDWLRSASVSFRLKAAGRIAPQNFRAHLSYFEFRL